VFVGRWGCFTSGIEDFTHGVETTVLWGWDFGDGVMRHPVQLYEAGCMGLMLLCLVAGYARRNSWILENGFYLAVAGYGAQRFVWEFLKPYGTLVGPLNLFHFTSLLLLFYGVAMIQWKFHEPYDP